MEIAAVPAEPRLVDVCAGRRLVACHGDSYARSIGQLHDGLYEPLSKGPLPHYARSVVVLQRARKHLHATHSPQFLLACSIFSSCQPL